MSSVAIIGLGNPGLNYDKTRHNLGFWLLDKLADSYQISFKEKSKFCAEMANVSFSDKNFLLVKPLTFMNESGKFLKTLLSKNNCEISQTILIHDEINLPVGQMKVTLGRGDGGHNGVKSVFASLGNNLTRLRLGVGLKLNPEMNLADYVLSKFNSEEIELLEKNAENFLCALKTLMSDGVSKTMNLYNQSFPKTA